MEIGFADGNGILKRQAAPAEVHVMKAFSVTRWQRYGHDRAYVSDEDGKRLGYGCLKTGQVVADDASLRDQVKEAVAWYRADHDLHAPAGTDQQADPATPSPGGAPSPPASGFAVGALTVNRWTKMGYDRAYVHGADGARLGYECLKTGEVQVDAEADRGRVAAATAAYRTEHGIAATSPVGEPSELGVSAEPTATPVRVPEEPLTDLANNQPGQSLAERAEALRQQAPLKSALGRVLGIPTEDTSWRVGAKGERQVGDRLDGLPAGWRILHAVPVGNRGSDIDHVVIGPPGVFTVNTKHHPDAKVWVRGSTIKVNERNQPYVRNSRHEAERAARLLSERVGFRVPVHGVIALAGCHKGIEVRSQPKGVHVTGRKKIVTWLTGLGHVLADEEVERVYEVARRSTT